jgi:hypothetical protein
MYTYHGQLTEVICLRHMYTYHGQLTEVICLRHMYTCHGQLTEVICQVPFGYFTVTFGLRNKAGDKIVVATIRLLAQTSTAVGQEMQYL